MKLVLQRLAALAGALATAIAVFVIAASLPLGFWPLAMLALAAFLGAGYAFLRLTERGDGAAPGLRRTGTWRWLVAGAVTYMIIAQLVVGRPPPRTLVTPTPSLVTRYWTLADGSRIAYEVAPATGGRRGAPVLVLHDGPGIPALPFLAALDHRPLDFLVEEGHDVYYYDQLGAGLSGRLDLTSGARYGVARHVSDIESIRVALDAPTLILAGTGWGATLALNYLLQHGDHVEKVILESPGPLWAPAWPETISPTARARMTDVQVSALAALERPTPRLVLGRMMADFSARAAHTFIPDWEADQWWTRRTEESIRLGQPNLTCSSEPGQGIPPPSGLGFFAYSYTLADAVALPDPRPALGEIQTEALILRGTCDYTDWQVSAEYLNVLPGARYVAVPAAGHFVWLEQRAIYAEVVRAFLRGDAVPLEVYSPAKRTR